MKYPTIKHLLLSSFLLIGVQSFAASDSVPQITVNGTAIKEVAPDVLRWEITVETSGENITEIAESQDKSLEQVIAFLKDQKIESKHIQTSDLNLREQSEYNSKVKLGRSFEAMIQISFRTDSKQSTKNVWLGLTKIKSVRVIGTDWDTTRRIELQNEARQSALIAAKAKAEAMAKTLGVEIAEPISISETSADYYSPYSGSVASNSTNEVGNHANSESSSSPGLISVSSSVRVSFRLTK